MLDEGNKLVPGFKEMRMLRAWAGVRPLYQETQPPTRVMSPAPIPCLITATRDGIDGFITITGGKWTTYRQMAEVVVNRVCEKLGTERPCRTHLEVLPDPFDEPRNSAGQLLAWFAAGPYRERKSLWAACLRMRARYAGRRREIPCRSGRRRRSMIFAAMCAWAWGPARVDFAPIAPQALFTNYHRRRLKKQT